jgi:hypothetical protein
VCSSRRSRRHRGAIGCHVLGLRARQRSATPQRLRTYIVAIFTAELEESDTQQPWFVPSSTDVASDLTQAWAAQARLRESMGARFPTARQQQRCHREHVRSARAVKPVPPTSQRLKGCGSPPRLRFNFPFQSHEMDSSLDSTLVFNTSSWRPRFNWPSNWSESEPDPPSGAACGDVPTAAPDAEPAEPPSTRASPTPALCGTSPCTDASVWIELIGTTGGSSGARRLRAASVGTAQPQASADDARSAQAAAAAAAGGSARPAWAVAVGRGYLVRGSWRSL